MVINRRRVRYTKEDQAGFCFNPPDAMELAVEKRKLGTVLIIKAFLFGIILVSAIIFDILLAVDVMTFDPPGLKNMTMIIIAVFVVVCAVFCAVILLKYQSRIRLVKNGNIKCIHIEVVEKLPEVARWSIDEWTSYFYPVMGRDTTTGYESVCYVDSQQYENTKVNDVISICVYPEKLQ